jgi:hypothetical protein
MPIFICSIKSRFFRVIFGTASILFFASSSAWAYTPNGDGTISTNGSAADVQAAVDAASAGAVVLIPAGGFAWASNVVINRDVSLQGAGVSSTTVACAGNNGLLVITNPTAFACKVSGISFNGNNASGSTQKLQNNPDSVEPRSSDLLLWAILRITDIHLYWL